MTEEEMLVRKALNFAALAHSKVVNKDGTVGQRRKGTSIPYIVHPVEVCMILRENGCSAEVQAAGLLHDTVEDTGVTLDEIEKQFGSKVRDLVAGESEDKMRTLSEKASWKARKQHTIDGLKSATKEEMYVCAADKLSNLRSMAYDLAVSGESLWRRFNASKEDIKWYYSSVAENLEPIKDKPMRAELLSLIAEVFD